MRRDLIVTTSMAALLWACGANAQQAGQERTPQAQQQGQVAEQCLADLQQFNEEMITTGYGITGPPG